jgi:hypothetical protein
VVRHHVEAHHERGGNDKKVAGAMASQLGTSEKEYSSVVI